MEPVTEPKMEPKVALNSIKYGIGYDLHFRKGKYYISVRAPGQLAHLYHDKRKRMSSGTSDRRLAHENAGKVLAKIHADFDKKSAELDPFVESLRPYLEQHGMNVGDWYTKGSIKHEFYGEQTWLWSVTGGKYEFPKRAGLNFYKLPEPPDGWEPKSLPEPPDGWEPKSLEGPKTDENLLSLKRGNWSIYFEELVASERKHLAQFVTMLGYAVPTGSLQYLNEEEAVDIAELQEPLKPDIAKLMQMLADPETGFASSLLGKAIVENVNDLPREPLVKVADVELKQVKFSTLVEPYLEAKTEATKQKGQRRKACNRVMDICGDLPLEQYTQLHAYDLAKAMDAEGFSHSQINKMITYGRGLFQYATKNRDENGKQYLNFQPWRDLELAEYGAKTRHYVPLSDEELNAVFAQDIPPQERLLLTILITTGMRLDEAALLTWQRVTDYNGVMCFCLVNEVEDVRLKNRGSNRYIPVPDIIKPFLEKGRKGRLFKYRIDKDGKAQAKASDAIMPYIRKVTTNDRKVAHSLRGNFKDLVREADVSKEINDFITGHAQGDVAGKYGSGPTIAKRLEVINSLQHLSRFPSNLMVK